MLRSRFVSFFKLKSQPCSIPKTILSSFITSLVYSIISPPSCKRVLAFSIFNCVHFPHERNYTTESPVLHDPSAEHWFSNDIRSQVQDLTTAI